MRLEHTRAASKHITFNTPACVALVLAATNHKVAAKLGVRSPRLNFVAVPRDVAPPKKPEDEKEEEEGSCNNYESPQRLPSRIPSFGEEEFGGEGENRDEEEENDDASSQNTSSRLPPFGRRRRW